MYVVNVDEGDRADVNRLSEVHSIRVRTVGSGSQGTSLKGRWWRGARGRWRLRVMEGGRGAEGQPGAGIFKA